MQLQIIDCTTEKMLVILEKVRSGDKISRIKERIQEQKRDLYVERQALRLEAKGKNINDDETIGSLKLPHVGAYLYMKDLGPQAGLKTVLLLQFFGSMFIYQAFYLRPQLLYGDVVASEPISLVVHLACLCYSLHFAKRIMETFFIHRFSRTTMPYMNLFKTCAYYWGFAVFMGYYGNHPLYEPPSHGLAQLMPACICFVFFEYGNFSIHVALRDLRPLGSKYRQIPMPTNDPFTRLFDYVSCPHYTYEILAWVSFTVMTESVPALIFTLAVFYQMCTWAVNKHKTYKKEFSNYPKRRKAIVPFIF